ncbi:MAG: hypothetical protein GYA15_07515 [Leptolinea sp.]|nr:hypothetical protein [Leptolinea sp.]
MSAQDLMPAFFFHPFETAGRLALASLLHRQVDENSTVTSLQGAVLWLNL